MAETSSSNLRQKHSNNETNGDRISQLPDAVLCHILSFLTTYNAVGTSLLSSRWRYVWTFVPILHFDVRDGEGLREEFMDRVMTLNRLPCLKKFYLRLNYGVHDPSHVNAWVCAGVMRNVEELHLSLDFLLKIEVPQILFTHCCEKLVVLKLSGLSIPLNTLTSASFPSLKILLLEYLENLSNDFVEKMLFGSPLLEDFELVSPINELTLYINSSSLKKLTIIMEAYLDRLDIVAPKLEDLKLSDIIIEDTMMNLPSLVEANINVFQSFIKLQSLICSVKILRLCLCFDEDFFEPSNHKFVLFDNLTHLEVEAMENGWSSFPLLLECSPNVEFLVVDMMVFARGGVEFSCFSPGDVPQCMLCLKMIEFEGFSGEGKETEMIEYFLKHLMVTYHAKILWCSPIDMPQCMFCLKMIKFIGFYGKEEEAKMIEYFLKHSMVLEKMEISWKWVKPDVLNRLLMFPRASSRCQIVLSPLMEGN